MTPSSASDTRTLPSGLAVKIYRPTFDLAPLNNIQAETYLADDGRDAKEKLWSLVADSINNASDLKGDSATVTAEQLKRKIPLSTAVELRDVVFELSGLVKVAPGETPAAAGPATGVDISAPSAAA